MAGSRKCCNPSRSSFNTGWRLFAITTAAKASDPERLVQLLEKMLKDKRGDDQVLEAARDARPACRPKAKKLVVASVAKQQDKAAAWRDVLKTFAGTNEANNTPKN
jgi:hypothetical protein